MSRSESYDSSSDDTRDELVTGLLVALDSSGELFFNEDMRLEAEVLLDEAKPVALVIEADDPSLELLKVDVEKLLLDLTELTTEEGSKLDLDILESFDAVELVVSNSRAPLEEAIHIKTVRIIIVVSIWFVYIPETVFDSIEALGNVLVVFLDDIDSEILTKLSSDEVLRTSDKSVRTEAKFRNVMLLLVVDVLVIEVINAVGIVEISLEVVVVVVVGERAVVSGNVLVEAPVSADVDNKVVDQEPLNFGLLLELKELPKD